MIKEFCDLCTVEITKENRFRDTEIEVGESKFILRHPGTMIQNECYCKYCVIDNVKKQIDNRVIEDCEPTNTN